MSGIWVSCAEVAEIPYTAFASKGQGATRHRQADCVSGAGPEPGPAAQVYRFGSKRGGGRASAGARATDRSATLAGRRYDAQGRSGHSYSPLTRMAVLKRASALRLGAHACAPHRVLRDVLVVLYHP